MSLYKLDTTYIDKEYANQYPQYVPKTREEIDEISNKIFVWQRYEKTELVDKGIKHLVVFGHLQEVVK